MAHAITPESTPSETAVSPSPPSFRSVLGRGVVLAAIVALLSFVAYEGQSLYREWTVLQTDLARTRLTAVVGYPGIHPHLSLAQYPSNWFHHEGDHTMLWGGWRDGVHTWFRVGRGEVERAWLSQPRGRDIQQAIDRPLVESGGGTYWGRVPDNASVIGDRLGGVETAYPVLLLDKVGIVNDMIQEHPFLVTYNSFSDTEKDRVTVYDPVIEGHRVTVGFTGYSHGDAPVFYDRGTESLWVPEASGLRSFAGAHKGAELKLVDHPAPVAWSRWRSQHPQSRLVVGADRSSPRPGF